MSRELIVSVNGREKKIAIVENERVTEFYIERGEQNQGIVGNIYKGRVMRVLPGMQSAFVDIGLDRDAFLYVTDFFDEEAEFERIVVDKARKGDAEGAARAAAEQIEMSRVQREQQLESTHERAEPLRDAEPGAISPEEKSDEAAEETGLRRRGRRGGRGRSRSAKRPADVEERSIIPIQAEPIDTPFAVGASFERISDDEERALNGEMFKDARLQERITDAVHAVEFDLEDVPAAAVGSLLSGGLNEGGAFQRVADEEENTTVVRHAPQLEAAHLVHFVDEVGNDASSDLSFQRVSDDEENSAARGDAMAEPLMGTVPRKESSERRRKKTGVIGRLFKSKKAEDEQTEAETDAEPRVAGADDFMPDSEASITTGRPHEEFATRRGGRRRRRPSKRAHGAPEEAANGANGLDDHVTEDTGAEPADAFSEPIEMQAPDAAADRETA